VRESEKFMNGYEWVETFKSKRTSVLDKAEAGRLSTLCTHNHTEKANSLI